MANLIISIKEYSVNDASQLCIIQILKKESFILMSAAPSTV